MGEAVITVVYFKEKIYDKKQFFLIILTILSSVFVNAQQSDPESYFAAVPMDGGRSVLITDYVGSNWTVRIPLQIREIPVTHIGNNVFNLT